MSLVKICSRISALKVLLASDELLSVFYFQVNDVAFKQLYFSYVVRLVGPLHVDGRNQLMGFIIHLIVELQQSDSLSSQEQNLLTPIAIETRPSVVEQAAVYIDLLLIAFIGSDLEILLGDYAKEFGMVLVISSQ